MGKIHQGILGSLSSSVGMVTGAVVKGRPTIRRKVTAPVNPNTAAQQQKRSAFGEASAYCRENWKAILAYCEFKERKGRTIWNQAVSWYLAGGRLPVVKKTYHGWHYLGFDWLVDLEPIFKTIGGVKRAVFDQSGLPYQLTALGSGRYTLSQYNGKEDDPFFESEMKFYDGELAASGYDLNTSSYIDPEIASYGIARSGTWLYDGGAWDIGLAVGTWIFGGTDLGTIEF